MSYHNSTYQGSCLGGDTSSFCLYLSSELLHCRKYSAYKPFNCSLLRVLKAQTVSHMQTKEVVQHSQQNEKNTDGNSA